MALSSELGIPLAPSQADLTPFQRMVLLKELERQQAESDNGQGLGGAAPGPVNTAKTPYGGGRGETVTYTNEHALD
ncbi:hypothetical protein [Haloferax larsenii]|uniref:hypothetical protein n=1 Tax=Haloferax larsenii TaxID=302484 RepID=UPI001B8C1984|nr:hypothetical protein [Haloferax larsenii]